MFPGYLTKHSTSLTCYVYTEKMIDSKVLKCVNRSDVIRENPAPFYELLKGRRLWSTHLISTESGVIWHGRSENVLTAD